MKDKVIVLTGAASGMGLATAKHLAAKGAKVALADVQAAPLKAAVEAITAAGGQAIGTVVDVRDRQQVEAWIREAVAAFGPLDGAANLAGVIGKGHNMVSIQDMDDADWDFVTGVNEKGLFNCLRAQIPHLKDGGSIVNAASVSGIQGSPRTAAYTASKHAVVGLTRVAARELGPRKIRCNCFCPGAIDTPMLQQSAAIRGSTLDISRVPLGRLGQPSEVANLVEWLLSDGSSYISGTVQVIDGGWVS
ncbi:NAD(P)-binding domain protein [Niveomyces insectorum RCEF 264]|uniref:NAD(P)-binding domain protein n=1 Tax=Niveomyces insectorum RCEF 264 TaxID=1081102 RepID=A0A167VEH3_9HYPO|nr:NAD(P)-binding domain protein [Niveomyces insectorum RCEF 264]